MGRWLDMARPVREVMDKAGGMLDDKQASRVPALYAGMQYTGQLIPAGTRINWRGTLKRAAVDLWDREDRNPDNAPGLWEDLLYQDGERIIPEVITAGLAFARGERGWWKGTLYESVMDANVYTPDDYPAGWQVAAE